MLYDMSLRKVKRTKWGFIEASTILGILLVHSN